MIAFDDLQPSQLASKSKADRGEADSFNKFSYSFNNRDKKVHVCDILNHKLSRGLGLDTVH